ncbi:hypothetical protein niasHT_034593 [Heterodera trifolii]|uniref:sphinganine-1-phosphate aldolase n=1 Tax=Heterodera trifolii TaxID=157864 RepID=A0ABD2IR32_9BILA
MDHTPWRVVLYVIDDFRIHLNRRLDYLEQWQIVLYTLSFVLFVQWVRKVLKFEEFVSFRQLWNDSLLSFSTYKHKWEENKENAYKELEDRMHRADRLREFYKYLPDRGLPPDDIIREATAYKTMSDILFERGRLCGSLYAVEDEDSNYQRMIKQVFELYSHTNAAFPEACPSIRKMEAECIRILCSLFHGGAKSCGVVTTSGSESIILACLAYRNSAHKNGIRRPEIIVPLNAHVGFFKAAKLLGMRLVRVGTNSKGQVNIGAIKRAIGRETCLIVASAPAFVNGVMDEIEEISQLALRFSVPVHVDASIGGFLLPFMEQCDYPSPAFDFRISGVSSINVDMHKYGFCPVGSSAVLYRDTDLLYSACYTNLHWSGGMYVSPTLDGTRSGLLIALTWATLLSHGRLGFVERTQRILDTSRMLRRRLEEIPALEVVGDPLGPVLAIVSANPKVPIHALGDEMNELGWSFTFLQNPNALRMTISLHQTKGDVIDQLVDALKKCCDKILTATEEYKYPVKTNVIFGISAAFADRDISHLLPNLFVDALYSTPTSPQGDGIRKRTLSIEGRKMSHLQVNPAGLTALQERYGHEYALISFQAPPAEKQNQKEEGAKEETPKTNQEEEEKKTNSQSAEEEEKKTKTEKEGEGGQ